MPNFDIVKKIAYKETFRNKLVVDSFSLKMDVVKENFIGKIPIENDDWSIGAIYGGSGTGKTTIAKQLWKKEFIREFEYSNASVIDDMPKKKNFEQIASTFNSVGFSTVWSWLKPYGVLSQGEQMRVNLARALLEDRELIVFDEFTSVVNREVAKSASAAISKSIRKTNKKLIVVSCHDDILEWLQPDWVFSTDTMAFARRSVQQRKIDLSICRCERSLWRKFRKYHYLDTKLANAAHTFCAIFENRPVAFFAVLHFSHPREKKFKRGHRLVVLPDYQGLGIGHQFSSYVAEYYKKLGFRFIIRSFTKSLYKQRRRDQRWIIKNIFRVVSQHRGTGMKAMQKSYGYSYEFIG